MSNREREGSQGVKSLINSGRLYWVRIPLVQHVPKVPVPQWRLDIASPQGSSVNYILKNRPFFTIEVVFTGFDKPDLFCYSSASNKTLRE